MHYITLSEFTSPGTVTCKVQGLTTNGVIDLRNYIERMDFQYSGNADFFEMDTRGVDVLNILGNSQFNYRVVSQSTVIEVSNIGSRTDKVQKTIWTLGK